MRPTAVAHLFFHELQAFLRSPSLWVMIGLPIPLSYFVVRAQPAGTPPAALVPMWVLFAQVMIGILGTGLSLVEEREKRTLEALLVSFASYWDVIAAKFSFLFLTSVAVQLLVLTLNGGWTGAVSVMAGLTVLGAIVFTLLGLLVGMLTSTVRTGSAAGSALMVILFLTGALFTAFGPLQPVLRWLPNVSGIRLVEQAMSGAALAVQDVLLLVGWAAVFALMIGLRIRAELNQ